MRAYKNLLQTMLRESIHTYRKDHSYTQERMAELLHISPRSYIDQEHGKYSFSALSVVFYFLLLDMEAIWRFLQSFRANVHKEDDHGDAA